MRLLAAAASVLIAVSPAAQAQVAKITPKLLRCMQATRDVMACVKFSPRHRMRGLWYQEMEGSFFFEDMRRAPAVLRADFNAPWLDLNSATGPARVPRYDGDQHVYLVEFEGRESLEPGTFGHDGLWSRTVIVDRLLSIRRARVPRILHDEHP